MIRRVIHHLKNAAMPWGTFGGIYDDSVYEFDDYRRRIEQERQTLARVRENIEALRKAA